MKSVSIITGSDLRQVQGVNYFIKSFLQCNDYFSGIKVNRVYSSLQRLCIDKGDEINIGEDVGTINYNLRIKFRTLLRKLLTSKFYPFALFRYELNFYHNSINSVKKIFADNAPCEYIIFQEIGCAYYYFKYCEKYPKTKNLKTFLVIHSEDDSGSMLLNTFSGYGRRDMEKRYNRRRDFVYSKIDRVIYISKKAYNHSILPASKRGFVYNGSPDVNVFSNDLDALKLRFVCVGSMAGRKGQDKIIEAMHLMDLSHLNRLHMTFVGDGQERENLQQKVTKYNLSEYITFTGKRNDVPEILCNMDVFIMPSTVEGLPMSAVEAMRAGLFLILTDTGGNVELCEEGGGFVCSRDPKDILSKIYKVMDSGICSKEQKFNSRERYKKYFSLQCMAKGYESILTCNERL